MYKQCKKLMYKECLALASIVALLCASTASAQDAPAPVLEVDAGEAAAAQAASGGAAEGLMPDEIEATAENAVVGWDKHLSIGGSGSLGTSNNVVGQQNGLSTLVGVQLDGGMNYLMGQHEWRNSLVISEAAARTPIIDQFVKSNDVVYLESLYLYKLKNIDWIGPFIRAEATTALFPGYDVRPQSVWHITDRDGNLVTSPKVGTSLKLSSAFLPLALKQTVGAFFKMPSSTKEFTLEGKVGFSAMEIFADGQRAVNDDSATANVIEILELDNVIQMGPAISIDTRGELQGGALSWFAGVEAMTPIYSNDDTDRSMISLTNVLFNAGFAYKLNDWASLNYQLRALLQPQLVDQWQIQNNLMVSASYNLIKSQVEPTE